MCLATKLWITATSSDVASPALCRKYASQISGGGLLEPQVPFHGPPSLELGHGCCLANFPSWRYLPLLWGCLIGQSAELQGSEEWMWIPDKGQFDSLQMVDEFSHAALSSKYLLVIAGIGSWCSVGVWKDVYSTLDAWEPKCPLSGVCLSV